MPEPRVINKYPNRRLYDTEESRYIRLADVRSLVLGDVPFVVVDKRSGADITRCILLQVIAEEEHRREPLMSREFLSQVIRAHGRVPAAAAAGQLERCLDTLLQRGRPTAPAQRGCLAAVQGDRGGAAHPESARKDAVFARDCKKAG